MTAKAVLFDLDGTLLDTSEGVLTSVRYTLRQMGCPEIDEQQMRGFIGPPIQISLHTIAGFSEEEALFGADIFRDYYKREALMLATPYPGIIELLKQLRELGVKTGVATYKREDYAIDLLRHFGIADLMDVIHGADMEGKLTKADIVELCIKELNEPKPHTILVGDTDHDAKGAEAAGVEFVAVSWGFGYQIGIPVSGYPCRAMIDSPMQLLPLIQ